MSGVRLRQVVLAAADLDPVAARLREELELGEPFADPGVAEFGLRNAVFALGDTFLEVVSPARPDTAAGRLIDRRGGDCGYMLMFQVDDVAGARAAARRSGVREVFAVALDDMTEAHLHPSDIGGAIVSVSQPEPPSSWRWGGPDWEARRAPLALAGATVGVPDSRRWTSILGDLDPGVRLAAGDGLEEIVLSGSVASPGVIELDRVRVRVSPDRREEMT
jgi:glyoxalase-like protein